MKGAFGTLIAVLAVAAPLRADDWPMMGGRPDRNMVSGEKGLPETWDIAKKKNLKWVANLGTLTYGTPVVAGGRVFIGTNKERPGDPSDKLVRGVLKCFSETDGSLLWQVAHEKLPGGEAVDAPGVGVCSTPCVAGDRVYYVSNRDELVCRSVKDGKPEWVLDMRKELGAMQSQAAAASPLVVGDLVFVVTGHGADAEKKEVLDPKAPSFVAVNRSTGAVVWQNSSPGANILEGQWGSPAFGVVDGQEQVAFPGGDGWLYAFEPATGKPLWKFNCKVHEKRGKDGKPETLNHLVATPVYSGHRILIATGQSPENGHDSDPGCLRAIDARGRGDITAKGELWQVQSDFGMTIFSVAVQEDLLYATDIAGRLHCLEVATGKRVWIHDHLTNAWGAPLAADGRVYACNQDMKVLVFKAGREKKILATNDMQAQDFSHGTVTAANGVLYLACDTKLCAIASTR